MSIQEADGHWAQNMWLDGTPYWSGIQMDETAFPILLADALRRADALGAVDVWDMVYRAACFSIQNGPMTPQDRWEEDSGFSPFTLAVEIAGLLAAADFADLNGEPEIAAYLRATADCWNDQIERWTYVRNTDLVAAAWHRRLLRPHRAAGSRRSRHRLRRATSRSKIVRCRKAARH